MELKDIIRDIPDFPKKGIIFKDITTLLKNRAAFMESVDSIKRRYMSMGIDKVAGIESRGFIFGGVLAYLLGSGFVPLRKPGKLPAEKIAEEYKLEYGTDSLEIHKDAIDEGDNVLIVDDLLATGGTASAAIRLIKRLGGNIVGVEFLIELSFLNGRKKIDIENINSLIKY